MSDCLTHEWKSCPICGSELLHYDWGVICKCDFKQYDIANNQKQTIDRLTRELADARAEAERLQTQNAINKECLERCAEERDNETTRANAAVFVGVKAKKELTDERAEVARLRTGVTVRALEADILIEREIAERAVTERDEARNALREACLLLDEFIESYDYLMLNGKTKDTERVKQLRTIAGKEAGE